MTIENICERIRPVPERPSQSSNDASPLLHLPVEIFQIIANFLSVRDINLLSQACRTFYILLNDNNFWTHRIRSRFQQSIAKLCAFDLFENLKSLNRIMKFGRQILFVIELIMNLTFLPSTQLLILMMKLSHNVIQKCIYRKKIFLK